MSSPYGRSTFTHMVKLLRPYEMCFMLLAVLLGSTYLTAVPKPATVTAITPRWLVVVWALALLASGVAGFVACGAGSVAEYALISRISPGADVVARVRRLRTFLEIERAAQVMQIGALTLITVSLTYGWAVGELSAPPALGLGFMVAWTASNAWRTIQVASTIKEVGALIKPEPKAEE